MKLLGTLFCSLSLLSLPALAADSLSEQQGRAVDALFAGLDRTTPGCAVGVYRDGGLAYSAGYGMADLEQGVPVRPSSRFQIASMSKQFTGMAMVLLEQEGLIDLDAEIYRYFPELPRHGDGVTVRRMLQHTSGMRDVFGLLSWVGVRFGEGAPITVDDAMDLLARQTAAEFPAGSRWAYRNPTYWILGQLPPRVAGMSLREWTDRKIFQPLGMAATHFHDDPRGLIHGGRTRAYEWDEKARAWRLDEPLYETVGAGGLYTTVEDLAKWDANFQHKRVGGDAGMAEMHDRAVLNDGTLLDYALGIRHKIYRGATVWEHGGSDGGYRMLLLRFPEHRFGVSVLCNGINKRDAAYQIADLVLGERLGPAEPAAKAGTGESRQEQDPLSQPLPVSDYVGHYWTPDVGVYANLVVDGQGRLVRRMRHLPDLVLEAAGPDRFKRHFFERDAAGRVSGFRFGDEEAGYRFVRVEASPQSMARP